jgi:glycosyl transferase family 25
MIRTYIISMKYPDDLMRSSPQKGLLPIWLPATNGKEVSDDEKRQYISPYYLPVSIPGSIGCSMSHMRAWEELLKSGDPYAVVLEDDVVFEPDFTVQLHRALENVPSDYDILALGCFGCTSELNVFSIGQSLAGVKRLEKRHETINSHINEPSSFQGSHAYVITRSGAQRCLQHLKGHINKHIDYAIADLMQKGYIKLYSCTPRIVYQTSSDASGTSMMTNVSHPVILSRVLKKLYIDKMVTSDYAYSVGFYKLGPLTITPGDLLFLALGLLFALLEIKLVYVALGFLVISIPDLLPGSGINRWQIAWHFGLLMLPILLLCD